MIEYHKVDVDNFTEVIIFDRKFIDKQKVKEAIEKHFRLALDVESKEYLINDCYEELRLEE